MTLRFAATALAMAALVALRPGLAKADETFFARALGAPPSQELVDYVAKAAVGETFADDSRPDLEVLTVRQFVRQKCGSSPDVYLSLAGVADKPDDQLGKRLYGREWPACLYATSLQEGATTYRVQSGDHIGLIWQQFTGSGNTTAEIRAAVTKASTLARGDVLDLMPGDLVVLPTTISTSLTAKTDLPTFRAGLKALGLSAQVKIFDPADNGGEILFPVFEGPTGQFANAGKSCVAGSGAPFDAALTARAFAFARKLSGVAPVKAIIVDNGFFGVRCDTVGCPPASDPYADNFPRRYFTTGSQWALRDVGPRLLSGFEPVNYYNRTPAGVMFASKDIDADSGHGTHVAGLVLGGPAFLAYRRTFNQDASDNSVTGLSWLQVVVLNVAAGTRDIQVDAYNGVVTTVNGIPDRKVVNMSLVFTSAQNDFEAKLRKQMRNQDGVLFVAAAGNQSDDLDNTAALPARFGTRDSNVLTVASVDGDGRISQFSNWSSTMVDIVAPGCQIGSWLDGRAVAVAKASGTSQAAPLASFTATLLRAVWDAEPLAVKNRIGVSGDLIDCPIRPSGEQPCVAFRTALNPWKALLIDTDVVTLDVDGRPTTRLGRFQSSAEVRCGPKVRPWPKIKALKKLNDGSFEVYWSPTGSGPVQLCVGKLVHDTPADGAALNSTHRVEFTRQGVDAGGAPVEVQGEIVEDQREALPIDLATLREVVFRSRQ